MPLRVKRIDQTVLLARLENPDPCVLGSRHGFHFLGRTVDVHEAPGFPKARDPLIENSAGHTDDLILGPPTEAHPFQLVQRLPRKQFEDNAGRQLEGSAAAQTSTGGDVALDKKVKAPGRPDSPPGEKREDAERIPHPATGLLQRALVIRKNELFRILPGGEANSLPCIRADRDLQRAIDSRTEDFPTVVIGVIPNEFDPSRGG